MKILITGAGGMLGSDLVTRLKEEHKVVGVVKYRAPHLEIPHYMMDLENSALADELVKKERPEVILHTAAMIDVDGCEIDRRSALLSNFEMTRHLAEVANRIPSLLVFFSTDFVFDGLKTEPYREEDIPHPLNVYGETKLLAERYLYLRAKSFIVIRTSWLFGKYGNNFPAKILRKAEAGGELRVVSDQFGNPTYTVDLADAVGRLLKILEEGNRRIENQIYHFVNEGTVSRYEFAKTILRIKNYPTNLLVPISSEQITSPATRPRNSSLSTEKANRLLDIRLRHWEKALREFLEKDLI